MGTAYARTKDTLVARRMPFRQDVCSFCLEHRRVHRCSKSTASIVLFFADATMTSFDDILLHVLNAVEFFFIAKHDKKKLPEAYVQYATSRNVESLLPLCCRCAWLQPR